MYYGSPQVCSTTNPKSLSKNMLFPSAILIKCVCLWKVIQTHIKSCLRHIIIGYLRDNSMLATVRVNEASLNL